MNARKLMASVAAAAALAAVGAAPAQAASLSCPEEPMEQAFAPWLDYAHYAAVPQGSFEADGWTLTGGAQRIPGNTPWREGDTALSLPAGSRAVSPPVCVSIDRPTLRAFARNTGSALGSVSVNLLVPTLLGQVRLPVGALLDPADRWAPTLPMPVLVNLLTLLGGRGSVRIELIAAGGGTDYLVDDVLIDPYSKG